eukprot:4768536-Amphidinium_carterae.1
MARTLKTNFRGPGVPVFFLLSRSPLEIGVDTQWSCWRNPVQKKRVRTFEQSMNRVGGLGLPAHVKARIVKSLHSVGLYGAEVGGIPKTGMTKIRTCARKALGKGAGLR